VGRGPVVQAAKDWAELSETIDQEITLEAAERAKLKSKEVFYSATRDVYLKYEERLEEARNGLLDAMRHDVGP
jgi:hypothetical protein